MGNEIGNPASKLGITALSITTPNIELKEFEKLLTNTRKVITEKQSQPQTSPQLQANPDLISREELQIQILKPMDKFSPPDHELFNQLFILFDETGYNLVDYKAFLSSAAVVLLSISLRDKLRFAFSIYDVEGNNALLRVDIKKMLLAINSATAYFGDPVLDPKDIEAVTLQMSKDLPAKAKGHAIDEVIEYLLQNSTIQKFMRGDGTIRFGSPELRP